MPIPETHIMERLSVAYVRAVAAKAGACLYFTDGSEYGTDGILQEIREFPNGKYAPSGYMISVQIKATTRCIRNEDQIVYDLEADAYNKIVTNEGVPIILVVFSVPTNSDDWISIDELSLTVRECCYWSVLSGNPTSNSSSKRITIPRRNLFTADSVESMFSELHQSKGSLTGYGY